MYWRIFNSLFADTIFEVLFFRKRLRVAADHLANRGGAPVVRGSQFEKGRSGGYLIHATFQESVLFQSSGV
jgi:hypothetical protein